MHTSAVSLAHAKWSAELFEIEAWSDMISAAPPSLVAAAGLEVRRVGGAICVVAPGIPSKEFNRAVGLSVEQPANADDVRAVLDFYRSRGVGDAWVQLIEGVEPAAIESWLHEAGARTDDSRGQLFDRGVEGPDRVGNLAVVEVDKQNAGVAAEVFLVGYGLPAAFTGWFAALVGRPGRRVYLACDGPRPVAAAFLYQRGQRALLAGAATLPEARGRGGQTSLIARRIRDAAAAGARIIQCHTWLPHAGRRNPSFDNMLASGFRPLHQRINVTVGGVDRQGASKPQSD